MSTLVSIHRMLSNLCQSSIFGNFCVIAGSIFARRSMLSCSYLCRSIIFGSRCGISGSLLGSNISGHLLDNNIFGGLRRSIVLDGLRGIFSNVLDGLCESNVFGIL